LLDGRARPPRLRGARGLPGSAPPRREPHGPRPPPPGLRPDRDLRVVDGPVAPRERPRPQLRAAGVRPRRDQRAAARTAEARAGEPALRNSRERGRGAALPARTPYRAARG